MAYTLEATFISAREVRIKVTSTVRDSVLVIQKPASFEMVNPGIFVSNVVGFDTGAFQNGFGRFNIDANTEGSATINYPTDVDEVLFMLVTGTGYDNTITKYVNYMIQSNTEGADASFDTLAARGFPVFIRSTAQPLTTPTGLYADKITSDSARVSWTAVDNASGYKVEYRRQGDTTWNE